MSSLPKLLEALKGKIRNLVELERELADLDRQIRVGDPAKRTKKKRASRPAPASHCERFVYLLPMLLLRWRAIALIHPQVRRLVGSIKNGRTSARRWRVSRSERSRNLHPDDAAILAVWVRLLRPPP